VSDEGEGIETGHRVRSVCESCALRGAVGSALREMCEVELHDCGAAGSAAAWGGACATYAAPPSRRGWIRGGRGTVVLFSDGAEFEYENLLGVQQMKSRGADRCRSTGRVGVAESLHVRAGVLIWR
jgi:hypothetical protein